MTLSICVLSSKVKVICQSSESREENVAKVVGATSAGGFLDCVSKNVPTFDLLWSWHRQSDYDIFWQKRYWESKKSDDALLPTSPI